MKKPAEEPNKHEIIETKPVKPIEETKPVKPIEETKPVKPTEETKPKVEKEFDETTDCVNPKILDDGDCYKNTIGRWKINQIKTFTDSRCKPERIVDDCPPEKIEKMEYDCSPDEISFCKNAIGQLKNCKDKRTPITTDEQDMALVKSCGLKGLIGPVDYKKAQEYFSTKGLTLSNLPDINCTDFSQEVFCKNPTVRMENCRSIQTNPNTDQKDLEIIRKCGANSNAISDVEYKKAQEYFSGKGLSLANRPSVNCMDETTQNFCENPKEQVEQCKFLRNTTDAEDFKRVQDCYSSKIKSNLIPEDLQKYESAKEYFKTKNFDLILPDVNCLDKSTDAYCKNPISQMEMCQKINGNVISKEDNLRLIQSCARNNKITPEQYAKTKEYLKTKGIELPNMPDVNCTDLSTDAYCKNPIQRIQFCSDINPTELELNTHLSNIKNCMLTKKIENDKYKEAQDFFKQKNMTLSDVPDINCADESETTFCNSARIIMENCKDIRSTTPEQYAELVKKCSYNGVITEQNYNNAKEFLKSKNIVLSDFPNVVCSTMKDDDFCKTPSSYLKYCKDDSTLDQDLQSTRICGILGKTSQDEYKEAQIYFSKKGKSLIELPDVDCKNTNANMFCSNPVSHMTYCAPMRNKTIQQDFDAVKECATTNKISRDQYNRAKEYFKNVNNDLVLPNLPDVDCTDPDSFCKTPASFIEFCKPQLGSKTMPQLLNDVKKCKINNNISNEMYQQAQSYFSKKGFNLPSMPEGVNCKDQTIETFCNKPVDHINFCSGTGIGEFDDQVNFNRVQDCVLNRKISQLEQEKAKAYFNSQKLELPSIPDVTCSDQTNNNKFCEKPTSYMESCYPVRKDATLEKDYATVIECMKKKVLTESEYNRANEYFKKKHNRELPSISDIDCNNISTEKLCSDPLPYLQKCATLISPANKDNTRNLIINCSKQNLISQTKYDEARIMFPDLPKYEPFNCIQFSLCSDPATYIQNCKSLDKKTDEEYKNDIIQCVKDNKLFDVNYNKASEYLKSKNSVVLPDYNELISDCKNICVNPVGTLKYCKDRKFTLDQEVQQINECILNGTLSDKNKYDQVKTFLDENSHKLKNYKLLDFKFSNCRVNCTNSFCNQLPQCLECNTASNYNNPQINKFITSNTELAKAQLCSIEKYPEILDQWNELSKNYPDHFKPRTQNNCFNDNGTIYVACGFAYGSKIEAQKQCSPKVNPQEYSLVTLGKNPCTINRGSPTIFLTQCKNSLTGKYNAYMNRNDIGRSTSSPYNCADGNRVSVVRWIGDGLA